jgi:NOL1/NOP2/fmu family ribosome biogenesis protein
MQQLKILNSRDVKKIREQCVKQFGDFLKEDYAYLLNENDRLFIVNKDIQDINLKNLIIDRYGFYFAEVKENQVRLSKEGAQLLAQQADKPLKNVITLNKEELKAYFSGIDLNKNLGEESKMIILQYQEDTIGCARYKDNKIINFLPKMNRGEVII